MRKLENDGWKDFVRKTPPRRERTYKDWSKRFQRRQNEVRKPQDRFKFQFTTPALLNLISDWHVGHSTTEYKRIEDEINAITATANSFVILAGDVIDNMNWNPGQFEQMEQTPQQIGFARSVFKHMMDYGKLLHAIMGDHEGWLQKAGYDIYGEIRNQGISVSTGPTYFEMLVGKQKYNVSGAHQLPGHSIYNKTHPQMRAARFGSMHGSDVIFSGHNHQKGVSTSFTHELGMPQEVTYIALGPYKATDGWLAKKGWGSQKSLEMFGVALHLSMSEHAVETDLDIVRANERMRNG